MKIEDLSFCLEVTKEGSSSVNGGDDISDFILSEDDSFVNDFGTDSEDFITIDSSRSTRFALYSEGLANMMNSFYA
jgi:hypothetical protein